MPLKYIDFKIRFEFISIMTNMKKKNPLKVGYFSKLKKYSLTSLTAQMSKTANLFYEFWQYIYLCTIQGSCIAGSLGLWDELTSLEETYYHLSWCVSNSKLLQT